LTLTKTEDKVRAVMTRRVVTIKPDAPVRKALQAMIRKDIGSLLVVKNKEPVGIITERDVTRRSLHPARVGREAFHSQSPRNSLSTRKCTSESRRPHQ